MNYTMTQIIASLETRQELKEFFAQNKNRVIILKASATWCGPCKRIEKDFLEMYKTMCPNAILLLIDIDDADDIASFLKIRKVPTMLNFVDGRPMDAVASSNLEEIRDFFQKTKAHLFF
jgi:thioredoxin-like negative regulator of GroEL